MFYQTSWFPSPSSQSGSTVHGYKGSMFRYNILMKGQKQIEQTHKYLGSIELNRISQDIFATEEE